MKHGETTEVNDTKKNMGKPIAPSEKHGKSWEKHRKMGKPQEKRRKMGTSWENHRKS